MDYNTSGSADVFADNIAVGTWMKPILLDELRKKLDDLFPPFVGSSAEATKGNGLASLCYQTARIVALSSIPSLNVIVPLPAYKYKIELQFKLRALLTEQGFLNSPDLYIDNEYVASFVGRHNIEDLILYYKVGATKTVNDNLNSITLKMSQINA